MVQSEDEQANKSYLSKVLKKNTPSITDRSGATNLGDLRNCKNSNHQGQSMLNYPFFFMPMHGFTSSDVNNSIQHQSNSSGANGNTGGSNNGSIDTKAKKARHR